MKKDVALTILAGILSLMLTWTLGTLASALHGERHARIALLGRLAALEVEVVHLKEGLCDG